MTDNFEIPEGLKQSYMRVIHRAPEKLRPDSHFQHLALLHLKVGGERLAHHNTELFKLVLEEEKIFRRGLQPKKDKVENDHAQAESVDGEDSDAPDEEEEDDFSSTDNPDKPELQAGPQAHSDLLALNCWEGEDHSSFCISASAPERFS